ncbi:hypothetical protein MMC31_002014 [Peltigera leucophlebia]|nr:hypothetical protein [Peltigera leucophlebia]
MNSSLNDLVPCFYGRDVSDYGGQQDPAEFIETLLFAIDGQTYTDEARKQTATRVIFRTHLRDKALFWYQGLAAEVRGNWKSLEATFLTRFALVPRKEVDQRRFLNLVVNFRQRGRNIVEYTREGDKLNAECPEKFRDVLGHQFIAGLDDKGKVDLVQVYLGANKSTVSYADAKQAVERAYQRFGEPSPFDDLRSQPSSPPPTPVQSELVALLQALRIPPPAPLRDNPPYRSNYGNTNMRDQNGRPTFYQGIYCHNCREEGHYSTSCIRPVVSGAQRNANRWAIDELHGGPHQYPRGPGMVPGLPPPQSALAVVASGGVERQRQGGQRINNIGMANVVILKRPAVKETGNDFEHHHKYPIAALTQSHELAPTKFAGPKVFQPTLQITTPVTRIAEKPLVQEAFWNLERLNKKTARLLPVSLPLPEDDDEMEDSKTGRGDSYSLRGVIYPGQDKHIQFEEQDDGAHDQPPSLPRPEQADKAQDDRFQTEPFLETPAPPHTWQRLDRFPRPKAQLPRAIASSWDFKGEEKLAGPKLVGTAAVPTKFLTPPVIKSVAHEDKEGCDGLLLKRWTCKVDWGPEAKTIWGRSIPKILHLMNGRPVRLDAFPPAEIMLGFIPEWKVTHREVRPDISPKDIQDTTEREIMEDWGRPDRGVT